MSAGELKGMSCWGAQGNVLLVSRRECLADELKRMSCW